MNALPEALQTALAQADETYLAGLSSKGLVNRAKKDLTKLTPEGAAQGDGVEVRLGEEVCLLKSPLGDSVCTCPSQGMCRHRIAAILWLKEQTPAGETDASPAPPPDLTPLLEVPLERVKKALGAKAFHQLIFRLGKEGLPEMEESSVVRMNWGGEIVKLLTPLEHSTCTCRSAELCRHKAAALLCYQIKKERVALSDLAEAPKTDDRRWDLEQVQAAAQAVEGLTAELLDGGLSRLSDAAPDSARRLSALCHAANLPRLETGLRTLSTLLERALNRSAAFRTEDLLYRLSELFHLARQLEGENADLPALAGTFRDEYRPCPDLALCLLGEREFHADSGFEGTVFYFWDTKQGRWYTYTNARPTFYESRRRPPNARTPAPWGLTCLMDQLYDVLLTLEDCKATADGRLSSTESAHAVIGPNRKPWEVLPPELCWTDFSAMYDHLSPRLLWGPETERVVLVRPARCEAQAFDKTAQKFRMLLYDAGGRVLPLEVQYRAEENALVKTMEKLAEEYKPGGAFLCLARLAGEDVTLYPIEYFKKWKEAGP